MLDVRFIHVVRNTTMRGSRGSPTAAQLDLKALSEREDVRPHAEPSAGIAQLRLVNSMYPTKASELFSLTQFEKPHEATVRAVARATERFDFTVRAYRKITDELVSHLLDAAGTLASALEGETKTDNQPAAIPTETRTKVVSAKQPH